MKRAEIRNIVGEMTVIGYQPEIVTLNPNATSTYNIIITKNGDVYISEEGKDECECVAREEFVKLKGLFDDVSGTARFRIKNGKYAGEYVIDNIVVTEDFEKKTDYTKWMK